MVLSVEDTGIGIPDEDLTVGTYVLQQALKQKLRLRELREF